MSSKSPRRSGTASIPAREGVPVGGPARSPGAQRAVLWVLAALVLAAPTVTLPNRGVWLAVKAFAVEAVGILLAVYIVSRGEWTARRVRAALLSGPNPFVLAFLGWIAASLARVSLLYGHPDVTRLSLYEAMRHLGGALIYFAVLYGLSVRRHLERVLDAVLLAAGLAALLAFLAAGETDLARLAGAFRNAQLLAAFLCLLTPLVVMVSLQAEQAWRRLAGQVVLVIVLAALLVTQNRSSWAGALVGLGTLALLSFRFRSGGAVRLDRATLVVPALVAVLAVGLFLYLSRAGVEIGPRARTLVGLRDEASLHWRLGMWSKALRMARDRPLAGWGVGTFPIQQALYYHPDRPSRSQKEILEQGPSLSENAHNTYLQLMAELGVPGLALYLSIYAAFFATAFRQLRHWAHHGLHRRSLRRTVLLGAAAGIAGQLVSGIGNPAWEFPECSLFLWLVLGLGMAAAGVGERGRDAGRGFPADGPARGPAAEPHPPADTPHPGNANAVEGEAVR